MRLTLKKPVTVGSDTVTELVFREELVSGDMRGIKLSEFECIDKMMTVGGRLCGQPDTVMFKLGTEDMENVMSAVLGFYAAGRVIGKQP